MKLATTSLGLLIAIVSLLYVPVFASEGELAGRGKGEDKAEIQRNDHRIKGEPGIELFVREVRSNKNSNKTPLLLIHGARVPGIPSFDLQVPNGSLAEDLAEHGFPVYIMDVRGYGRSTRPPEMSELRSSHPPLVRSTEAVRDLSVVVDWIQKRNKGMKVAILGWATGGLWAGHYTTMHPDHVRLLILYNTIYGGSSNHPTLGSGSPMEDPNHPGRFNEEAYGAYRLNTASSLLPSWDSSIPVEDKSEWRDPRIVEAYVKESMASDETGGDRMPESFRSPSGAMEDTYYLASGRQLWDASLIRVPTVVIQSEYDFWSRHEDRERLVEQLVHAPYVKDVLIEGATHYAHLDRPDKGRNQFIEEVLRAMNEN
ncbi:alpha/beta hydrolase fold protein [Paenibacillus mucilaginosus 3016]|uniref:Alpha/beta hydrolase fold protein n=1 Tax=Paenibacillus mucilaginosus 3016 TaxID=1116391 RepID=H6NF73_9BACL|nr:alpha/beta fold hydrolase [Paenibacillus mucilaginosus]AFC29080.1 alpha/beta hydrolase fold protein [Paenibacillus mucilaginosus 3016]WFA17821.1 alpha/beta fold hydrolase [Paenibacillus mucilaginosus]